MDENSEYDLSGPDQKYFFRYSHDLFCIAGFDGYFKDVNQAVCDTLGYSREELFGRPINSFVYSDDQAITEINRENLRKSVPLRDFDNRYITKSGEIVWLSWSSVPVPEHKLVYAVARNITHKKEQDADRNRTISDLSLLNTELKQLLYTIAHDLRSPVNSQIAAFNLIETKGVSAEDMHSYHDLLKLSAINLKTTLDSYLDLLISKNNFNAEKNSLFFDDVLNQVTTALNALIRDSGATVKSDFSEAVSVNFNAMYLYSILLNLITNSIKYARPGVNPEITIRSMAGPDNILLIFSDNGSGFDVAKAGDRLFQLNQHFHHGPDSKGIGLYLVQNHLKSFGGTVAVESTPGKGTTFKLTFLKD